MLSAYTDYFSLADLASFYAGTPDPLLNHPPFAQRLTIIWRIPQHCFHPDEASLQVEIRFRNKEDVVRKISLKRASGRYLFCLNRERYCSTGGILAYHIQIVQGEQILEEWTHHLWSKLIFFDSNESEEDRDIDLIDGVFDVEENEISYF